MILIPELEIVVILVPRTGTGSLRRAVAASYPKSIMIYRHMEADGLPLGYDRWRRVGVVRHPVDRLWSLYKFLRDFGGDHDPAYIAAQRASVAMPFSEWITGNETVFTSPYDSAGKGRFWPQFTVRHPLPETRKSQFLYLRPDLGTSVFPFEDRAGLYGLLRIDDSHRANGTEPSDAPTISQAASDHVERFFSWDFDAVRTLREAA